MDVSSADSGKVTFQSSQEIRLRPGFVAEAGSEFRAYIDDIPFCSLADEAILLRVPERHSA